MFYWLKHCIKLELLSVDLAYMHMYVLGKCKFKCFVYPVLLSCVSHSIDICTVPNKSIRNMHTVSKEIPPTKV